MPPARCHLPRPRPPAPSRSLIGIAACALGLLLLSGPAAAAVRGHLGAEALTDFPVQVGGKLWGELPYRLRLSTSLGYMPGAYLDAVNAALVSASVYDRTTAAVIRSSLTSSLVFRLHGGWRPFARRGFYLEAGYGLVMIGGGVGTDAVVAMVTGLPAPAEISGRVYEINSKLHMVDAELGWQWLLYRGLSLRAALGFAATLSAQSQIRPAAPAQPDEVEMALARTGETVLNQIYTSYVFTPTGSLAVGWRFF